MTVRGFYRRTRHPAVTEAAALPVHPLKISLKVSEAGGKPLILCLQVVTHMQYFSKAPPRPRCWRGRATLPTRTA